ncbi:MAG: RHS repeat-associated core domain-containing protein, partial [candidate division WOR-3 bacterium]
HQPFGEMLADYGGVHGFTGKELDSESGLNYFCQRYYDSQIGRFMTLDPIDDKNGSSPYAYCSNNPLKFTDPTGEKFSDIEMEKKYWFMKDYGMWKAGFQDYRFLNYDEWGNLIGIDYYSPNSVNNPYLESYIIPPAVYFAVAFSICNKAPAGQSGRPLTNNEMIRFMQVIYAVAMYGGYKGRLALQGYIGKSIFSANMGEGFLGFTGNDYIILNMDLLGNSFEEFAKTIIHEGLHGGPESEYYNHKTIGIYVLPFPLNLEDYIWGLNETVIVEVTNEAGKTADHIFARTYPRRRWFNF